MRHFQPKRTTSERKAQRIVEEILDKGLANSTWRDKYPEAYNALLHFRLDLETSAEEILAVRRSVDS